LFHRNANKGRASSVIPLKDLIPIVSAEQILSEEKRSFLLEQIRTSCALEPMRFDNLCLSLARNLANHYQLLPETTHSYYAQSGGLINHALNRTEVALELFKQFLIVEKELSEEQKLWQYALLSAGLLQGIGKLYIDLTVNLFDSKGHPLKQWNPLLENLQTGNHYSYVFEKEENKAFRSRLNIILATNLMPASGFAWIASNKAVLEIWLALLNEDFYSAGTLGIILINANAIAIRRYFHTLKQSSKTRLSRYGQAGTFIGRVPKSVLTAEQKMGIDFLEWLYKALEKGDLIINKFPFLKVIPGGLLMSVEIFKIYNSKAWEAAQNAFLSLGLHKQHNKNLQVQRGLVLDLAIALPKTVQVANLKTGEVLRMSSTELINQAQHGTNNQAPSLHHLNSAGQWQLVTTFLDNSLSPQVSPNV
jgi:integrating conjugative element relaxase (TIGR03760 family)